MRKRRDLGQPSDIAFLLIIFFLLLAGINTTQSIDLRTSTSKETMKETVILKALLTQQGTILLDDSAYTPFEFAIQLTPNTTLHLQVEGETSWQQVVDLLSLTEQRQIAGLSLTMANDSSEGTPLKQEREMAL
ncbi:MAG: biopolymer transporter ExbD [Sphaerochaeta sp.]|nr:biopolymer transporter ExbD [Sphaerochaeta sp.]